MASKRKYYEDSYDECDSSVQEISEDESAEESESNDSMPLYESSSAIKQKKQQDNQTKPSHPLEIEILKDILQKTKPLGSYSFSGEASELPQYPGIHIKNFGPISLPMYEKQAKDLLKNSEKKWNALLQIEPSSIEIRNPEWRVKLQELVERICGQLGCKGKVEPKLKNLCLFLPGYQIHKHRDSITDPQAFATMLIQLPSSHQGGDLLICNNSDNSEILHDFGKRTNKASYAIHFAAHYADAEHAVTEVTSGYRLVLAYSLCWTDKHGMNKLNADESVFKALQTLKNDGKFIGILLDNCYEDEMLEENGILDELGGIDKDRFDFLQNYNEMLPADEQFEFNVAHAQLTIEYNDANHHFYGGSDSIEYRVCGRESKIVAWFDADGKSMDVLKYLEFNSKLVDYVIDLERARVLIEADFNHEDTFGEDDMNETFDGCPKFNDCKMTQVYNKYLMIMVPKNNKFELYFKMNFDFAVDYLETISESLSGDVLVKWLRKCVEKIEDRKTWFSCSKAVSQASLITILQLLIKANNLELFKLLLSKRIEIVDGLIKPFAICIVTFEWNKLKNLLAPFFETRDFNKLVNSCKLVEELIRADHDIAFKCLKQFIFPTLDNFKEYSKELSYDHHEALLKYFTAVANTVAMLKMPETEIFLANIVKMIINEQIAQDKLHDMVIIIRENLGHFKDSPSALLLVRIRVKWLEERVQPDPPFSWRMNANFQEHRRFLEFLKSDERQVAYGGCFSGVHEARNFIKSYSGLRASYSVTMDCTGVGQRVVVNIRKTQDAYIAIIKNLSAIREELQLLKAILATV